MAIHIDPQKEVVVRAPRLARENTIREFLSKKATWILRKLGEARQRAAEVPRHNFLEGDVFLYRGESYSLKVEAGAARNGVSVVGSDVVVRLKAGTPPEDVPGILRKWYIARAREILNDRVLFYSQELDVTPDRVAVRGQSRRWGSCSSKGNINLNWKLIMAPPYILDYVVAHEVCHLMHPNHSPAFWRTLGSVMQDYAARRDWLKQNGHRLGL